jgi:glc operon protein GlcG
MKLVILSVFSAAALLAQAPPAGGGRAAPPPPKQTIDVATAKKMVAAAEAAALAANAIVSIAVVDTTGDLVYFERMDGAQSRAVTSSQGKPIAVTITNPQGGEWDLTPAQGGLPMMKDGKIVAAIGVGGSAPANDEKFAQAGLDSVK